MKAEIVYWTQKYRALVEEKHKVWEVALRSIGKNEADLSEEEKKQLQLKSGLILSIKITHNKLERKIRLTKDESNIVFFSFYQKLQQLASFYSNKVSKEWGRFDEKERLSQVGLTAAWEYLECFDFLKNLQPHSFVAMRMYGAMVDYVKELFGSNPHGIKTYSQDNDASDSNNQEISVPSQLNEEILSKELKEILSQAINNLPSKYKDALFINIVMVEEDIGYTEASERFKMNEGTLKTNVSRAREMLRTKYPQLRDLFDKE